ncbi:hypothetical protein RB195_025595 [Necator americanus]|uniref:Neurotransmitter-gated ion-channel ligand-binding domain-containing protein n=1 Tax=Necator americanus TaxID=51031 RepID=A0ABR1ET09_NECAM
MYFNSSHVSLASPDEYRLLSDLRHNYDPYERPVANASEPLVVSVKIYLQQILDVDEKNQVITLVAWVEYQWTDYKLKWEPSEYGGIKDIRVPGNANAIWKPDVLLYNSADENFDSTYPVNYVVSHTGHVLQVPPGILKLSCKIDITYFPFDDQMCHLKAKKAEDMAKKTEMRNGRSLEGVMTATDSLSLIRSIRASKNDQQQSFEMDLVPTGNSHAESKSVSTSLPNAYIGRPPTQKNHPPTYKVCIASDSDQEQQNFTQFILRRDTCGGEQIHAEGMPRIENNIWTNQSDAKKDGRRRKGKEELVFLGFYLF